MFGKPLRANNTKGRPVLFKKADCIYYDDGHTQRLRISGDIENYKSKIWHDDRKSLKRWLLNQASYSEKEALMLINTPSKQLSTISKLRKSIIFAPLLIFFYTLFFKGLLLNGWRGWYYALQRFLAEALISLKQIELNQYLKKK